MNIEDMSKEQLLQEFKQKEFVYSEAIRVIAEFQLHEKAGLEMTITELKLKIVKLEAKLKKLKS